MSTCEAPIFIQADDGGMRVRGCVMVESEQQRPIETDEEAIERRASELADRRFKAEHQRMAESEIRFRSRFQQAWDAALVKLKSDIETQLIDASVQVAETLLRHQLPDAVMLRAVLADVLRPVSDMQGMRVRLAPMDLELHRGSSLAPETGGSIEWVADPSLAPGDVIVESRNGIIDGRLHERLAMLAEAMRKPAEAGVADAGDVAGGDDVDNA